MKKIGERIYDLLLGCTHRQLTRPFTIDKRTYCVCCDCGREFTYSLDAMSIVAADDFSNNDLAGLSVLHSH